MFKECSIYGHQCWDCIDAFREMVQRSANGDTLHRLNNLLMRMSGACHFGDSGMYSDALREFMAVAKSLEPTTKYDLN
jgi:hypothetical protein